jgi:hypothetical protein
MGGIEMEKERIQKFKDLILNKHYCEDCNELCGIGESFPLEFVTKYIIKLEKENDSKEKEYNDCYCEFKHYKQYESISKSKVKEKIEEIDRMIKYLNSELTKCYEKREKLGTETEIDSNELLIFSLENAKDEAYTKKQVLQELMEDK